MNLGFVTIEEFEERSFIDVYTGCWIWIGSTQKGYGAITVNKTAMRAHRLAWELYRGPIPPGVHVCHTCDNPPCVNPAHLWLGTMSENLRDCVSKGRHSYQASHPRKLTRSQIAQIRAMPYRKGMMTETARAFGVSRELVSWHWWHRPKDQTLVETFRTEELLADIERKSALGEIN